MAIAVLLLCHAALHAGKAALPADETVT